MSEQPTLAPTALRPILPTDAELNRMMRIANSAARSGIGGCSTPQEAFAKLITGWSMGIDAGTALNNIKCIDGRMTAPELIKVAAVRRSGIGDVRTVEVADDHATVEVTRADWPADRKELVSFTEAHAVKAGLMTVDQGGKNTSRKDNWRKYASDMFLARARGTALRRWLEEASSGLPYSPDELGADTDADGNIVELDNCGPSLPTLPSLPALDAPKPAPTPTQARPEAPATPAVPPGNAAALTTQAAPVAAVVGGSCVQASADPVAAGLQDIENKTRTEERYTAARGKIVLLRWDTPTWKAFLSHHFGVQKFADLPEHDQNSALGHLDRLHRIEQLYRECQITPAQQAKVLEKRGLQHIWQLSPEQTVELAGKLADMLSPFRRTELGITDGGNGNGHAGNGHAAPNGSTPATGDSPAPAQQAPQRPQSPAPVLVPALAGAA